MINESDIKIGYRICFNDLWDPLDYRTGQYATITNIYYNNNSAVFMVEWDCKPYINYNDYKYTTKEYWDPAP